MQKRFLWLVESHIFNKTNICDLTKHHYQFRSPYVPNIRWNSKLTPLEKLFKYWTSFILLKSFALIFRLFCSMTSLFIWLAHSNHTTSYKVNARKDDFPFVNFDDATTLSANRSWISNSCLSFIRNLLWNFYLPKFWINHVLAFNYCVKFFFLIVKDLRDFFPKTRTWTETSSVAVEGLKVQSILTTQKIHEGIEVKEGNW